MQAPARSALAERTSNIRSPLKSPSKIPLPPSPSPKKKQPQTSKTAQNAPGSCEDVPILLQRPDLVCKTSEAQGQTYVSPSDNILSPTTKKLSEVKGRRIGQVAYRLFKRLLTIAGISRNLPCTMRRICLARLVEALSVRHHSSSRFILKVDRGRSAMAVKHIRTR